MSTADDSAGIALGLITALLWLALYVWTALALSAVFRKCAQEPWKAWVPVLNLAVLLRLGGLSPWFLLLLVIPVLGQLAVWVVLVIACYRVNTAFGYGAGLTVVAALVLPVWASILGFGPARWIGADAAEDAPGPRRAGVGGTMPEDGGYVPRAVAPAYTSLLDAAPRSSGFEDLGLGDSGPVDAVPPRPAAATPQPARTPEPDPAPVATPPEPARTPEPARNPEPVPTPAQPSEWDAWKPAEPAGERWGGFDLGAAEATGEVTDADAAAPAPISAVPVRPASADPPMTPPMTVPADEDAHPATTRPPVTRTSAVEDEPWAPARSPLPDPDAPAEASGEVSAIAGAPAAGAPRSASAAVAAQHARPAPADEDPIDQTIITRRRRTAWELVPPGGTPIPLAAETVILGRKPAPDPAFPKAQLVVIADGTVSKTHARLVLREDRWFVTDLGSTNGVLFATLMGTEIEVPSGEEMEAGERFYLGDAEVRLQRSEG